VRDLSLTLRVICIGATRFGLRCLQEIEHIPECKVVGAVTAPKQFSISYRPQGVTNVLHADFGEYTRQRGIPCLTMREKMREPALMQAIRGLNPNLFVVAGWYHMVPKELREMAPAVGLHASLLPDYCGGAPLVWAMINGEKRTGISLFQLGDGVDDGPILAQAEEPILDTDTIATLYDRIEERGLELLRAELPRLARGESVGTPQDLTRRRVFPQRSPEDGAVDWQWSARRIYDFVRAQTRPYPGAFTQFRGERLTLWRVEPREAEMANTQAATAEAGLLTWRPEAQPAEATVTCGERQRVALCEVEWLGTTLSGAEFARQVGGGSGFVERVG